MNSVMKDELSLRGVCWSRSSCENARVSL